MSASSVASGIRAVVLGGGPDAERGVSLDSARGVFAGLVEAGVQAELIEIDRLTADEVAALPAGVVFPVLHGGWGEGGGLQRLLEMHGRAFVGSGSAASAVAMDKMASKLVAARCGLVTADARVLDVREGSAPMAFPFVVKPVHDGSSYGLFFCRDEAGWAAALAAVRADCGYGGGGAGGSGEGEATRVGRVSMVEPLVSGRELTVPMLDFGEGLRPLPVIEIRPKSGAYDYEAKYTRGDTEYVVGAELPGEVLSRLRAESVRVCEAMGVRHLARVDFILPEGGLDRGAAVFLELNTMPGFTATSLLPKAAAREGLPMAGLVKHLVGLAAG